MPEPDLALLIDAALEAGRIAERHWGQDPETWDKPDGAGPVTEADLEVDRMLHAELLAARPDYGWLSEETADTPERLTRDRVFVVDPIDGTRSFMAGHRTFAHALAVVEKGEVIAGVVYLPLRDKLYTAARGEGAALNGTRLRVSQTTGLAEATVLAAKPNFDAKHWGGVAPPMTRHFRSSLAYRLALAGEGRFDAMLTLRDSWEWDIAAGCLIVEEAGGKTTDRHGGALRFNNPSAQTKGVLAANEPLHAGLSAQLSSMTDGQ